MDVYTIDAEKIYKDDTGQMVTSCCTRLTLTEQYLKIFRFSQ